MSWIIHRVAYSELYRWTLPFLKHQKITNQNNIPQMKGNYLKVIDTFFWNKKEKFEARVIESLPFYEFNSINTN
jgi:hypothetical protein